MTNTWNDIGLSDCIMVIGGNPAENHPIAFKHITYAMENYWNSQGVSGNTGLTGETVGAKLISVDPRYTRTSSKAHVYSKMRSGTDIPFINGMINYVIQNQKYNEQYVLSYTNAGFLIHKDFKAPGDVGQDGLFSGYNINKSHADLGYHDGSYTKTSWQYCTYPALNAKEYKGINIATDFWGGAGNCVVHAGGCGWNKNNLSLDPSDPWYIGLWRQHIAANAAAFGVDVVPDIGDQLTAWEHMVAHFSRYDPNTVCNITGSDTTVYDDVCKLYAKTGEDGKVGTIMYAMGTTQHTVGTQNIRAYATLQELLGNMGLAGGGVNAMRGESNVQGSTDHCLLFHILPGYIKVPTSVLKAGQDDKVFDATVAGAPALGDCGHPTNPDSYVKRCTPFTTHQGELNWWGMYKGSSNFKKYIVSLLQCYWKGGIAGNNYNYNYLPKIPGNCSHITMFENMLDTNMSQTIDGLLCFGQNPAVGGPNSLQEREALGNLDWLIVTDLWETETAAFWQANVGGKGPLDAGQMAGINTEVFLLPAACHLEKDGSVTNSSRWAQYRYAAVQPPGNNQTGTDSIPLGAKHEIWILNALYEEILTYGGLTGGVVAGVDSPISMLRMGNWWYDAILGQPVDPWTGYADPDADFLDMEINGWFTTNVVSHPKDGANYNTGALVGSFTLLMDEGSTAAGNWLYTNMYTGGNLLAWPSGINKSTRRDNRWLMQDLSTPVPIPIYPNWSWDWPVNRRIIYNGASMKPCGWGGVSQTPWDTDHPVLTWAAGWKGDVNDGVANPHGDGAHTDRTPFIMKPEGHCRAFGMGRAEGPMPEHYEPVDTMFYGSQNPMGHSQVINPCVKIWDVSKIGTPSKFKIIATTYRCTEHWQAGAQTRNLPWQAEMMPRVVVEMSKRLAKIKGIKTGNRVYIFTARGFMKAWALVTNRFETYTINGNNYHHVGVFWHYGFKGIAISHSANILTPHVGDANTMIPEYKAFLCRIKKK